MYHDEKVIDGVLHYRTLPRGPWHPMTAEQVTARFVEMTAERDRYRDTACRLKRRLVRSL